MAPIRLSSTAWSIGSVSAIVVLAFLHPASATQTVQQRTPPNRLLVVKTNCTRDVLNVQLELSKAFRGVIFAKDFLDACRTNGNQTETVRMQMATDSCGIRSEHRSDGAYELSVSLIVQMDGKLRQMTDIEAVVRCVLPASMMAIEVGTASAGGSAADEQHPGRRAKVARTGGSRRLVVTSGFRNGRMRHDGRTLEQNHDQYEDVDASTEPEDQANDDDDDQPQRTPRVRVWMELGGSGAVAGAVEVGELTTFAVRAVLPGNIGVRVVDCAALDGIGDTSQKLVDDRGCPVDEQVMPALFTRLRQMDEGWSKPHPDDLVEKLFTATFPAFKFPDRERLHLSCGVQLCTGACPMPDCSTDEPFALDAGRHLARIEVFNSLTVTAPKIDRDRLRALGMAGRAANVTTADEYAAAAAAAAGHQARHSADGVLCMSSSRLALAFCVLGLVFLVAVVVSVYCLLRARTRRRFDAAGSSATGSLRGTGGTLAALGCARRTIVGPLYGGGAGHMAGRVHLRTANNTGGTGSTSIFSSSSGSQSRFSSKLIIAPGGSLPYGRVY